MNRTRVVLADPLPLVRSGLRALIETSRGFQVCAEAGNASELLDAVVEHRPALVVAELALPGMSLLDVVRRLRRHLPELRILLLGTELDRRLLQAALRLGVAGYVGKQSEAAELQIALRALVQGLPYLSPGAAQIALERRQSARPGSGVSLSTRQREVLQLVGRGKSTKEIAALMGVSTKTVETHRLRLMQALDLNNINALIHYATRYQVESGSLDEG